MCTKAGNKENVSILEETPTGIEDFDESTVGGVPQGRSRLIGGRARCGKALFGIEFLAWGVLQYDEPKDRKFRRIWPCKRIGLGRAAVKVGRGGRGGTVRRVHSEAAAGRRVRWGFRASWGDAAVALGESLRGGRIPNQRPPTRAILDRV